jgi:myo-inositol-1(or 4)-monophosphatase
MNAEKIKYWLNVSNEISENVEKTIDDSRKDPELSSITKIGADGTPTHKIDEYAENAEIEVLENTNISLILISEEIGKIKIGDDKAEILLILDPLDGTSNATRMMPCYGISIAIADLEDVDNLEEVTLDDIEIGYVKNFPTGDVYSAVKNQGATKNNKKINPISDVKKVSDATLCSYVYRAKSEKLSNLCSSVRRMRIMGSIAIEMCYVADGAYDAYLDIGKIVRILDIAASQLIIQENNGIVTDYDGNKLSSKLKLTEKTSIMATCTKQLHDDMMSYLH